MIDSDDWNEKSKVRKYVQIRAFDLLTFGLKEKNELVTSAIDVDKPFLPVDNVGSAGFNFTLDAGGLLFAFVSFMDVWDCC